MKPRQNNYVSGEICPDPTDVLVAPRSNDSLSISAIVTEVLGAVVDLGGRKLRVPGDALGHVNRATSIQVFGDASGPKTVAAYLFLQPASLGSGLHQPKRLPRSRCLGSFVFCLWQTLVCPEQTPGKGARMDQGRTLQSTGQRLPWPSSVPAPHESCLVFPGSEASEYRSARSSLRR